MRLVPDAFSRVAAIAAVVIAVAGVVILATAGGDVATIGGGALLAVAGVLVVSLVFYAVGTSEDHDRRHGAA